MPRPRAAMRKIRDVLRLTFEVGLTPSQVSAAMGLPRTTVRRYLARAASSQLSWPLPPEVDDRQLEQLLFGRATPPACTGQQPLSRWSG
jgi:hypothetical protein